MLLVAPDPAALAVLEQSRGVSRKSLAEVRLEVDDRAPREAVEDARRRHGGVPLGYVAATHADALEAIAAGADESLHLPELDVPGLLLLVDRTWQRAALRREGENHRNDAVHSAKLAALGTVIAGVAHEINNPLSGILLSAEVLRNDLQPLFDGLAAVRAGTISPDRLAGELLASSGAQRGIQGLDLVDELIELTRSIARIVRDLRIYTRAEDDETPQIISVPELVDQVVRVIGRQITAHGHIERDFQADLPLLVAPRSRLVQVLTNVLVNAAHAIREIERPVHRVRIMVRADDEAVAISVSDTGPGIPQAALERIFDPFYTTKREGVGTGLGLSISRGILRKLGGDLVVESVHGNGATFLALIPLPEQRVVQEVARRSTLVPAPASSAAPRIVVLAVDDDPRLLRIYARVLRDRYDVLVAGDGQEAVEVISSGARVDVVVTDLAMPELGGRRLHGWLAQHRPDLAARTVFVTASAGDPAEADFFHALPNPVLAKPASAAELFAAIDRVSEAHGGS